jgi:hypothetical protein
MLAAMDELEASYPHPSERIVALETILHEFTRRRPSVVGTPFSRFLRVVIKRRQVRWARRASAARVVSLSHT